MENTYRTNRVPAFVITILGVAIIFSIDIDRLLVIYQDPWGIFFVAFFIIINPLLLLFGFALKIGKDKVIETSYFFFKKEFDIKDISHVLYQPTWRGITHMSSQTNMRSLHIVRRSGGWSDTISLANGVYKEDDLANIAQGLHRINPKIELDEYAQILIEKYEHKARLASNAGNGER